MGCQDPVLQDTLLVWVRIQLVAPFTDSSALSLIWRCQNRASFCSCPSVWVSGDTCFWELPAATGSRGALRAELQKTVSNQLEANTLRSKCTPTPCPPCAQTQQDSSVSRNSHKNIFLMTEDPQRACQSSQHGVTGSAQTQAAPNLLQSCYLPAPSGIAGASGFLLCVPLWDTAQKKENYNLGYVQWRWTSNSSFSQGYWLQHSSTALPNTGTRI